MTENAQDVIECIERTFADVRLEDGVSLREAAVIDDYGTDEERINARSQDELDDWKKIPDDSIAHYYWCVSFFDAKGMRFHLPAYMCFALRHYKYSASPSIDSAIHILGWNQAPIDLFTPSQKDAVRRFLRFMEFNSGPGRAELARCALEQVWTTSKFNGH